MTAPTRDVRWWEQANCASVGGNAMHPEQGQNGQTLQALKICRACPVITPCLREALQVDANYGVRGGLTGDDRARVKSGRSALQACPKCRGPFAPKAQQSVCRLCALVPAPVVERPQREKATCPVCDRDVPVHRDRLVRHWKPGESGRRGDRRCIGRTP